ncbi:MAG: EAL domain-containing protein [Gallionellaceae bacterium]
MIQFISAPPDASLLYAGSYDLKWVVVSVLLAVFAAYAALNTSARIAASPDRLARSIWALVSAVVLGIGIWGMHFIGMLSLSLPCGVHYDPLLTFVSMFPGILASGVALGLIGRRHAFKFSLPISSVLLGAGIGLMHYTGMAAMHLDGFVLYDPWWFLLSLLVAVLLAYLALKTEVKLQVASQRNALVVALILGGAISGMHYIAMQAAYFVRGDVVNPPDTAFNANTLALAITLVTVMFALTAMILVTFSRKRELTRQLQESELMLRFMLETSPIAVRITSEAERRVLFANKRYAELINVDLLNLPGSKIGVFYANPAEYKEVMDCLDAGGEVTDRLVELNIRGKGQVWVLASYLRIKYANEMANLGWFYDITALKKSDEVIWHQANFDRLTGLPNRNMFRDRLEQEIKKAQRAKLPVALLLIDLDNFKEVNDTLGHDKGDVLLVDASRRLARCVRDSDTIARMGGDEFGIILTDLNSIGHVDEVAKKIINALSPAFDLDEETVFVSASIGITLFPYDATNIDDLLKHVDQAMYAAKTQGRNRYSYFTSALQEEAQKRMRLTNDLRNALEGKQFRVFYQPILELNTGRIHKAEALIRWQNPERGMISPAEFIPLAEHSGMIVEIGDWVFHQAAKQVKQWRERYSEDFQISVNKSPIQFRNDHHFFDQWLPALQNMGLPGSSIAIEITEGLLMNADAIVSQKLLALRDAGVQVAIDDFGTGYSALAYLNKFDIDYLKIDQSFVCNIETDASTRALSKAIIVMAHELGLKVIAEGIETEGQHILLRDMGCDYGQGYLFSRPVSATDFERLLN